MGCVLGVRTLEKHWWGEGEVKFYLDDDTDYPTFAARGSKIISVRLGRRRVWSPGFLGCPLYLTGENGTGSQISLYRFHVEDPSGFIGSVKVTVQQIGGAMVKDDPERLRNGALSVPLRLPRDKSSSSSSDRTTFARSPTSIWIFRLSHVAPVWSYPTLRVGLIPNPLSLIPTSRSQSGSRHRRWLSRRWVLVTARQFFHGVRRGKSPDS